MKQKTDPFMLLKSIKENKSCYFILLIIGIAFLILNILTPEYLDDYLYKYAFVNGKANTNYPIQTINDIIYSQINHYQASNGRVLIHTFVQLFTGILGKGVFNLVNALVFTCFIALSVKYSTKSYNKSLILISTFFILLCFPAFYDTCLWMTGSMNYIWTGLFTIIFLYIFKNLQKKEITSSSYLLVLGSIPLGWTHEGTVFPLALSLIVYCYLNREQITTSAAFPFAIGFIIGAFLCTFSPGTMYRASGSGLTLLGIVNKILSGFVLLSKLKLIYIAIAGLIWMAYKEGKQKILYFLKDNLLICGGIFFSMGIVFLSGFHSSRTAFGTELFSFLLIIKMLANYNCKKNIYTIISMILCLLYGGIVYCSVLNYKEYQRILQQIKEPSTCIITTKDSHYGIIENWIRTPLVSSNSEYFFAYSPSSWENQYIATTYHKDSLIFLPEEFIENISSDKFDTFSTTPTLPFYAKRLSDYQKISKVVYQLQETDFASLPFYIRPFAHKLGRYTLTEVETDKFTVINIKGTPYLLIGKNKMIDNRVKDIIYE